MNSIRQQIAKALVRLIAGQEFGQQLATVSVRIDDSPGWYGHGRRPHDLSFADMQKQYIDSLDAWRKNPIAWRTITTSGTAVQFTLFDTQNTALQDTSPSAASDRVEVDLAADYLITCSITVESIAGAGATFDFEIMKNNGASRVEAIHAHRDLAGGGGDVGSVSLSGLATLAANDTTELWVTNDTNTQNIIIEDAVLSVVKVS